MYLLHIGAADFMRLVDTYYYTFVDRVEDETGQYAMKTTISPIIVLNGTEAISHACTSNVLDRFSLLFKFKFEGRGEHFAVTLFEIEGQLSVTLDTCNKTLTLNYGDSSCAFRSIAFSLENKVDLQVGEWHKIGLSFSEDRLALLVNCKLIEWRLIPGCQVKCNENTPISLLTPNQLSSCNSFGEVITGWLSGSLFWSSVSYLSLFTFSFVSLSLSCC